VPSLPLRLRETAPSAAFAERAADHLRTIILPFWLEHMPDRKRGGFFGGISDTLVRKDDEPRGALLTARILWTFSAVFRHFPEKAYLDLARHAYADLLAHFWDNEHGGLYWSASAEGVPLRTRKQTYGQAFGIYALSEFHRATGEREPLERAITLFRLLEKHARDSKHGGYFEACTHEWQLESDWRLSAVDLNTAKSQNTLLHVMEGYTNLLRVWPDAQLKRAQADLLEIMLTRVLDARTHHLGLFFDEDWTLRSDRISFGHDIEAAWLLTEAARVLGNSALLTRVRTAAVEIAEVTLVEAVDTDGALLYEAGPDGITQDHKEWWPQAEAVVGFLNAYEISQETRWLRAAEGVWDFIEAHLVDRTNGEWYRAVTRDRRPFPNGEKAGFWKCPYHNGRACLEIYDRLRASAG
jgi:mannobiose 2-epimerase